MPPDHASSPAVHASSLMRLTMERVLLYSHGYHSDAIPCVRCVTTVCVLLLHNTGWTGVVYPFKSTVTNRADPARRTRRTRRRWCWTRSGTTRTAASRRRSQPPGCARPSSGPPSAASTMSMVRLHSSERQRLQHVTLQLGRYRRLSARELRHVCELAFSPCSKHTYVAACAPISEVDISTLG